MRSRSLSCALVLLVTLAAACGDDGGSTTPIDGPRNDAADVDGSVAIDAPATDAPSIDAPIDAMPTNSELIGFARGTADGTGLSLPIVEATVTYLKPLVGNDPAGFTIQVTQAGPALFVAVDPATLTPVPVKGDVVSFTITTLATTSGQKRATAITGFTRVSQGADVGALSKSVTAATDIVSALDSYDSEVIDVAATVAADFATAGSMFESALINTTGLTGSTGFRVRLPATLRSSLDLTNGCAFTLNDTPVGRFVAETQLAAFVAADITITSCPAPTVVSALALSATSVQVTFSRNILASSVMANGSQFTIDNGVTVSAAAVVGRVVTLTTSAQTAGTTYTVTAANTVTDSRGTGVGTPSTAMFAGFVTPAVVKLNEINANITGGCDQIELRVVSGGSMTGFKLNERAGNTAQDELTFTFGTLSVQTNDIIVAHVGPAAACNPGTSANETTGPAQHLAATFANNYDTAYDWYVGDNGLTATDNTITLFNATGAIVDVVLLTEAATGTAAAGSESAAAAAVTMSQWQNVGGGTPPGGYVDDTFSANAVLDLDGTSATRTGLTIQRLDNSDDNDKADWTSAGATATWGLLNVGQTPL